MSTLHRRRVCLRNHTLGSSMILAFDNRPPRSNQVISGC